MTDAVLVTLCWLWLYLSPAVLAWLVWRGWRQGVFRPLPAADVAKPGAAREDDEMQHSDWPLHVSVYCVGNQWGWRLSAGRCRDSGTEPTKEAAERAATQAALKLFERWAEEARKRLGGAP